MPKGKAKPRRPKIGHPVRVDWLDAFAIGGDGWLDQTPIEVLAHRLPVQTVGLLGALDEHAVVVVGTVTGDGAMGHVMHIPMGMVRRIERIG